MFRRIRENLFATVLAMLLLTVTVFAAGGDDLFGFVANRIYYGASNGSLTSEAAFTYNPSTNTLTVDNVTANGDVTLGNAAGDNISIAGTVTSGITLGSQVARTVKINDEGTADANAAPELTIQGSNKTAGTGNGGAVTINAGTSAGGTAGVITIGTVGSGVTITPASTHTGTATFNGTLSATAAVNLGQATVAQSTNVNTNVTCNGASGVITTQTATTGATTVESGFTLNNSRITASSVIHVQIIGYSGTLFTNGVPNLVVAAPGAGTVVIRIANMHGVNALNGTMRIHFAVL